MDANDLLFYGFGQIAYATAMADGKVQRAEHDKLLKIIQDSIHEYDIDYMYSGIIFELMEKQNVFTKEDAINYGLKNMHLASHKLNENTRACFDDILHKVADAFDGKTPEELDVIQRFNSKMDEIMPKL